MVAIRRPDGLYDVDGLNFPVPEQYVPPELIQQPQPDPNDLYNQQAIPPPAEPDMRLAMSDAERNEIVARSIEKAQEAGKVPPVESLPRDLPNPKQNSIQLGQDYPSQIAQGVKSTVKEAVNPSFGVPQDDEPATSSEPAKAQAKPSELNGPDSDASAMMSNPLLAAEVYKAMKGTSGSTVPEHLANTGEAWTTKDLQAPPGVTTETKELPDDAIPVWRNGKLFFQTVNSGPELQAWTKGEKVGDDRVGPKSTNVSNWTPEYQSATQETPNNVITAGAKARASDSADEAIETEEFNARMKADRDMGVADVYNAQAQREMQSVEELRARQAAQQDEYDNAMNDFRAALDGIKNLAGQSQPEPTLGRGLMIGLAQGLIYAGAAAAGQQVPHLDWIGQQIRLNFEKQRMQLDAGLHIAGLKLNALQAIRQHTTSPEAAQHMLAMADYTAAVHMGDSMVKQGSAQEIKDNWQTMRAQLLAKADENAQLATEAEHQSQIQRIPAKYTPGKPGGAEGVAALAQKLFPKNPEQQAAFVSQILDQVGRGEAPTMTSGKKQDRVTVEIDKDIRSRTWVAPAFMGGKKLYTSRHEDAREYQQYASSVSELVAQINKIKGLVAKAGSTVSPDLRRAIETEQHWLMGTARRIANTGVPQAFELKAIIEPMVAMDVNEIIKLPNREKMLDNVISAAQSSVYNQTAQGSFLDPELTKPFATQSNKKAE